MRQSQPQVWISRSAVVNRNLRTIQSRLFKLLSPVSTAEAGFGNKHTKCISTAQNRWLHPSQWNQYLVYCWIFWAVSHYSVLIMFNNWRVCKVWKPREERGEVQKLSFLHRPIPLSVHEIAHTLQNRTRESKKQVRATETVFPWDMQIGVN